MSHQDVVEQKDVAQPPADIDSTFLICDCDGIELLLREFTPVAESRGSREIIGWIHQCERALNLGGERRLVK